MFHSKCDQQGGDRLLPVQEMQEALSELHTRLAFYEILCYNPELVNTQKLQVLNLIARYPA